MGRYYWGDIEGKFWFAVQNSDCASRFGVSPQEPDTIEYCFNEENLEEVKSEIKVIKDNIGEAELKVIKKFFKEVNGYTDEMLLEYYRENGFPDITEYAVRHILHEYADLCFGKKLEEYLGDNKECCFSCEL